MLRSVKIKNFRSHKDTTLTLHPNVNVIVGHFDSGKSAIIGAIEFVRTNRPLGNSFIRTGSTTEVEVESDAGETVKRRKRKDPENTGGDAGSADARRAYNNSYTISDKGGNKRRYSHFGSGIPEDVTKFLPFTEVNIQRQHEPYFLVMDSPQAVAEFINRTTGLEFIMSIEKILRTKRKELSQTLTNLKDTAEKVQKSLESDKYKNVTTIRELLEEHEKHTKYINTDSGVIATVQLLVQKIEDIQERYISAAKLINNINTLISSAISTYESTKDDEDTLKKAGSIVALHNKLETELQTVQQDLTELVQEFMEESKDIHICPLCGGELKDGLVSE